MLVFLNPETVAFTLVSAAAIGFLVPVVDACIRYHEFLRFAWMSIRSWRDEVRVSVSYLYQIKSDDKYLLIRSRRFNHFQPVGGVFKVFPAGKARLGEMGARDDSLYPIDSIGIDDLRIRLKGKHLVRFFVWVQERRGRETDVWREFHEELIASNLLPADVFRYVRAEYAGTHDTGLRFSPFVQSKEVVFAEIYRLVPTPEQTAALSKLMGEDRPDLHWATEIEIHRRGAGMNRGTVTPISDHSWWIL